MWLNAQKHNVLNTYLKNLSMSPCNLLIQPSFAGWMDCALQVIRFRTEESFETKRGGRKLESSPGSTWRECSTFELKNGDHYKVMQGSSQEDQNTPQNFFILLSPLGMAPKGRLPAKLGVSHPLQLCFYFYVQFLVLAQWESREVRVPLSLRCRGVQVPLVIHQSSIPGI